ncbi:hypothetical protein ACFQ1S_31210 [Kibdelosporangium lantanae]|uniref:Uncharacterized protein n=1 Tax=Kibdelosporangium lantanae TaxID=1497396 RepID=A0ABW3MJ97_9PSEU
MTLAGVQGETQSEAFLRAVFVVVGAECFCQVVGVSGYPQVVDCCSA